MADNEIKLHPIISIEAITQIKDLLTLNGTKELDHDDLINYLKLTSTLPMDKITKTINEAKDIYVRYSDYRSSEEETFFVCNSQYEYEALRVAEERFGGKSFALSVDDLTLILVKDDPDNIYNICFKKNPQYIFSCIDSIRSNLRFTSDRGSNVESPMIYGFCKIYHDKMFDCLNTNQLPPKFV